jgi:hypothetical protein
MSVPLPGGNRSAIQTRIGATDLGPEQSQSLHISIVPQTDNWRLMQLFRHHLFCPHHLSELAEVSEADWTIGDDGLFQAKILKAVGQIIAGFISHDISPVLALLR